MLYKVVLISKSLDETLVRDHSKLFIKLYKVVLIFKSVEDTATVWVAIQMKAIEQSFLLIMLYKKYLSLVCDHLNKSYGTVNFHSHGVHYAVYNFFLSLAVKVNL